LGERGRWLARRRPEWAWALEASSGESVLPADLDQRWAEGTVAERQALLALTHRLAPARARQLVAESWKQEKAEQRLAWLKVLEANVTAEDESLLVSMLSDRSALVRLAAARLLWLLPESELARRIRARVEGLLELESSGGMLSKLKSAVGARPARTLRAKLPPEKYEPTWEKDGIVEKPSEGGGRRQFWLTQMVAAVPPAHWTTRWGVSPCDLVALVREHELSDALLDGFTSAAIRHDAREWYTPLWDAWNVASCRPLFSEDPEHALLLRLVPEDAEPRLIKLLDVARKVYLVASVPGPWPEKLSKLVLDGMTELRCEWTELLPHAALVIPVELLPMQVSAPVLSNENDYTGRAYLRALERFQTIAALRQSVAREIAS
jgi:hypothetical protein